MVFYDIKAHMHAVSSLELRHVGGLTSVAPHTSQSPADFTLIVHAGVDVVAL